MSRSEVRVKDTSAGCVSFNLSNLIEVVMTSSYRTILLNEKQKSVFPPVG